MQTPRNKQINSAKNQKGNIHNEVKQVCRTLNEKRKTYKPLVTFENQRILIVSDFNVRKTHLQALGFH